MSPFLSGNVTFLLISIVSQSLLWYANIPKSHYIHMSLNISHEIFPKQIIRRLTLYVPSSADCVCFYLRNFRRHFKLNYQHFRLKHNSIKTSWSHLTSAVCFLCWCGNRKSGLEISKSLTLVPFKYTWHMNHLEQSCLQVEERLGELLHWKWCVKTLWKQWAVM